MKRYTVTLLEIVFLCAMSYVFNVSLNWLNMNYAYIGLASVFFIGIFIWFYYRAKKDISKMREFTNKPVEINFSDVLKLVAFTEITDDFEAKMKNKLVSTTAVLVILILGSIFDAKFLLVYSLIASAFYLMQTHIFCKDFKDVVKVLNNIDNCSIKATIGNESINLDDEKTNEMLQRMFEDIVKMSDENLDDIDEKDKKDK